MKLYVYDPDIEYQYCISRKLYNYIMEEAIQSIHNYVQTDVTSFYKSFNYLINYKM